MKKEKKAEEPIAIDRLTGLPYGQEDGISSPSWQEIWTVDTIRSKAEELGKKFQPNPEIVDRLASDLANGALVFFTEQDVLTARQAGRIPESWVTGLIQLVRDLNDIGVVPVSAIPQTTLGYDDRNYR